MDLVTALTLLASLLAIVVALTSLSGQGRIKIQATDLRIAQDQAMTELTALREETKKVGHRYANLMEEFDKYKARMTVKLEHFDKRQEQIEAAMAPPKATGQCSKDEHKWHDIPFRISDDLKLYGCKNNCGSVLRHKEAESGQSDSQ